MTDFWFLYIKWEKLLVCGSLLALSYGTGIAGRATKIDKYVII